ncbi:MAG: efflux RND transporter permease subunit [Clostridia bacterium]|nr:efflux RND transporter permease subunit [Clostridia bacterium]
MAIVLIVVFVLAFGIYSTLNMSVNLLPDINVPMVCVQVIYPGANAQSVEKDVTEELEEGLSAIGGITNVDSYSYDNLSAVILSFDYGADTTAKKTDIQNKISSLGLPDGVITSVYDIDLNAEALAKLSVTSKEGLDGAYAAAKELEAKLKAIDGVENVEIKGGAAQSFEVIPFGGLELCAPLLVEAFSYGALDIPLGNIKVDGLNVQIRNNSDVTSVKDIREMPLKLPSQIVTLLTSVKQIARYYEDSTEEDLKTLKADLGSGVITVLNELDGMSSGEVRDLSRLKTYMNIGGTYTERQLRDFKTSRVYNEIYKQVTNEPAEEGGERTPKDDGELEELLDDMKTAYPLFADYITLDMLKVVRDGKIDNLIAFRGWLEAQSYYTADEYYEPTNEDYFVLETRFTKVYGGVYGYENIPAGDDVALDADKKEEILNRIDFAKKTSAAGLSNIADKKEDAENENPPATYVPTDGECALLFSGTSLSADHPVIMSPTFMAFVRGDYYEENINLLIARRAELKEANTAENGEEGGISAGQFFELYSDLKLEGVFEFKLSEELLNFILITDLTNLSNGSLVVKTEDIAFVKTHDEFSSYVYYGNGKVQIIEGAVLEIYKSNGANSSAVVEKVKKVYAEYLAGGESATYGASVKLLDDQSEFISDSISNVLVSMIIGGVLAVLVIYVFLKKVRTSLIIAVTMPLSVLAALICLNLMGITLNMVSLGGLAVGIGMLVDNSIVVIESISKHRDMDKTAFQAAVDGTAEVGGALFGSTLTTVCVFIPIIFSGGLTGEIFTDLSWAVIYSLAFSLIVAVTVIPALYALVSGGKKRMLKGGRLKKSLNEAVADSTVTEELPEETEAVSEAPAADELPKADEAPAIENVPQTEEGEKPAKPKKPKKSFKEFIEILKQPRAMGAISGFYGKALPAVLNKKLVTILTAVAVFGASIGLLFLTGTEFLPSIDKGQIEVSLSYGSGADLERIEEDVSSFATTIQNNIENIDYLSVSVGKNGLLALTDTGIITVQLTTNRGTAKVVESIRALSESAETKPEGTVSVREIDGVVASLMSGADGMSVTIVGSDGDTLNKIAADISGKLEENGFKDIKNSSTDKSTQYTLNFDRKKMAELGLDYQTTVLTLRIGIASHTACSVVIDGEEYNINVRFEDGAITSKEDLENFVVGADSDGGVKAVKLKDILIADENGDVIKTEELEACIRRTDGKQMVSVSAALPGTDTGSAGKLMQKIAADVLKGNPDYAGYDFESSGINSYLDDAFGGLAVALVISFFLLFAVMAVQFGSCLKSLIVMASIPFSFTGGFIALVITGTSLNVVSFIGLIMLMGVVVNNAIVMLEKIKQLADDGMAQYDAVQQACNVRLRPIFMTTLTTVLALIPLAIGVGQGSELMQPLGIVVIGGLLIGTLVTLALVPAVYCAFYGISKKTPNGRKGKRDD